MVPSAYQTMRWCMLGHKIRDFKPLTAVSLDDLVPEENFYNLESASVLTPQELIEKYDDSRLTGSGIACNDSGYEVITRRFLPEQSPVTRSLRGVHCRSNHSL